ncbi:MAG: DNA polymerase IV [Lachnospiraceae bacterium]|nr:DNA polymerase IV [Lachnospiraceae bacterium]
MRNILHSDCNSFYASVECLYRPEIRDKPVAVGGDPENRHGVILTKNEIAKRFGIKTGQTTWQAKQLCPELMVIPPNFSLYKRFSDMTREIYLEYTSKVEPFGLDEAWLDVTGCVPNDKTGMATAREISNKIKNELGITVSIGVSYNKIFAKLGSDYKKPDAITEINRSNFKDIVWPLPVGDLLYVGKATRRKLSGIGVHTIGELANTPRGVLTDIFGKWGDILYTFSNGYDSSPVSEYTENSDVKSVGNSTTAPKDLTSEQDVDIVMNVLCDSVSRRMRESGLKGRTVSISVRDCNLFSFTRQRKLDEFTNITSEITRAAIRLFRDSYDWSHSIRSVGVSVSDLTSDTTAQQISFFEDPNKNIKLEKLDLAIDGLKNRFGTFAVCPAIMLIDKKLSGFDPIQEHTIHPVGFFK